MRFFICRFEQTHDFLPSDGCATPEFCLNSFCQGLPDSCLYWGGMQQEYDGAATVPQDAISFRLDM